MPLAVAHVLFTVFGFRRLTVTAAGTANSVDLDGGYGMRGGLITQGSVTVVGNSPPVGVAQQQLCLFTYLRLQVSVLPCRGAWSETDSEAHR